jgi:hypothetical protein
MPAGTPRARAAVHALTGPCGTGPTGWHCRSPSPSGHTRSNVPHPRRRCVTSDSRRATPPTGSAQALSDVMDDPGDPLESAIAQIDDCGHGHELEPQRRLAVCQGFGPARRAGAANAEFLVFELLVALFTPGHAAPFGRDMGTYLASGRVCSSLALPPHRPTPHRFRPPPPLAPLARTRILIGVGPRSKRSRSPRST